MKLACVLKSLTIPFLLGMMCGCATTMQDVQRLEQRGTSALPELAAISEAGDNTIEVRIAAIKALGRIGTSQAVKALSGTLRDGGPIIRQVSVEALGEIGSPEAIDILSVASSDWSFDIREAAVNALIGIGKPASEALIRVAQDSKSDVKLRLVAAEALDEMGSREAAVNAFISIGKPASEALIKVAEDTKTDGKLRFAAVKALGAMGDISAVQPLLNIASADDDASLREAAVNALIGIGKPASETLIKVARDTEAAVKLRLAAVRAFGAMGDISAVQPLLNIASADDDVRLYETAVDALIGIGEPASEILIKVAEDTKTDGKLRFAAVKALRAMGDITVMQSLPDIASADDDVITKLLLDPEDLPKISGWISHTRVIVDMQKGTIRQPGAAYPTIRELVSNGMVPALDPYVELVATPGCEHVLLGSTTADSLLIHRFL